MDAMGSCRWAFLLVLLACALGVEGKGPSGLSTSLRGGEARAGGLRGDSTRGECQLLRLRGGAEKGKGDPRWIVQDREDGKNVGAWHWEEKNMFPWSREQLKGLKGVAGSVDGFEGSFSGSYEVSNVTKIAGDVVIHQRKGKLWPLCDLQVEVSIKGTMSRPDQAPVEVRGEIVFADVNVDDRDSLEVAITVHGSGAETDAFRRWLRQGGAKPVIEQVQAFLDNLKNQADNGEMNVSKTAADAAQHDLEEARRKAKEEAAKMAAVNKVIPPTPASPEAEASRPSGTLNIEEEFAARAEDVYDCFSVANKVATYTRCPDTLLEARPGGRLSFFSGQITGGFEDMHPPEFLKFKMRMADWPDGLFSSVRILLHELGAREGCKLELSQEGIPANKVADCERQWRERFFAQIKVTFGYGAVAGSHHAMFGGI